MAQNHTAEEDAIKANKPMTVTDGSVSFTSAPGDSSTVDVNGDVFLLNGTTADVTLNSLAVGTTTISFVGSTSINLTGWHRPRLRHCAQGHQHVHLGRARQLPRRDRRRGADAYRLGVGSQGVTVHDFSVAKGDTLTVDSFFKGRDIENERWRRWDADGVPQWPSSLPQGGPAWRRIVSDQHHPLRARRLSKAPRGLSYLELVGHP